MSKEFLASPVSYSPGETIETPYLRAKQEWDDRIGSARVQAKNWRYAFFFASFLSLLPVAGNFYQLSQKRLIPLVITLNKENGRPEILGLLPDITYRPGLQEVKYFLAQFLHSTFSTQ